MLWTGVRNNQGKSIPSHPVREEMALNSWGRGAVSRAPIPGHSVAHEAPLMGAGWQTQAYRSLFVPALVVAGGSLARPGSSFSLVTTLPWRHWEGHKDGSIQ